MMLIPWLKDHFTKTITATVTQYQQMQSLLFAVTITQK